MISKLRLAAVLTLCFVLPQSRADTTSVFIAADFVRIALQLLLYFGFSQQRQLSKDDSFASYCCRFGGTTSLQVSNAS